MLDNGSSVPRISSSNEVSEPSSQSASVKQELSSSTEGVEAAPADESPAKIPDAHKWTVSRFSRYPYMCS